MRFFYINDNHLIKTNFRNKKGKMISINLVVLNRL